MVLAELILLLANVLYATSYVTTRLVLDTVEPATLALCRLVLGGLILVPVALARHRRDPRPWRRADRVSIAWMGLLGFAAAFALGNWGLAHSTATNAALLITTEPVSLILLSPMWLGEHLSRREKAGAALALAGAAIVVVNGIPGLTRSIVPHWRGDLLLVLSGVAYASYSLLGRSVLARHPAVTVTGWSVVWGAVAMLPLAGIEWAAGHRPAWTPVALAGTVYLAVVITALGYLAWNYALERVPAPRAAIFLNLQPLVGALLGVGWLGEPLTAFIVAGGLLIVCGVTLAMKGGSIG